MTHVVYRIAASTRTYDADDLTGAGAAKSPGRWNPAGVPVVYCAASRALALLETFVHIETNGFPANRYLVEIKLPDSLWEAREAHGVDELPVAWDARPAGMVSEAHGAAWLSEARSAVLELPSVMMPEESIILINPRHRSAVAISASKVRQVNYEVMNPRELIPRR